MLNKILTIGIQHYNKKNTHDPVEFMPGMHIGLIFENLSI